MARLQTTELDFTQDSAAVLIKQESPVGNVFLGENSDSSLTPPPASPHKYNATEPPEFEKLSPFEPKRSQNMLANEAIIDHISLNKLPSSPTKNRKTIKSVAVPSPTRRSLRSKVVPVGVSNPAGPENARKAGTKKNGSQPEQDTRDDDDNSAEEGSIIEVDDGSSDDLVPDEGPDIMQANTVDKGRVLRSSKFRFSRQQQEDTMRDKERQPGHGNQIFNGTKKKKRNAREADAEITYIVDTRSKTHGLEQMLAKRPCRRPFLMKKSCTWECEPDYQDSGAENGYLRANLEAKERQKIYQLEIQLDKEGGYATYRKAQLASMPPRTFWERYEEHLELPKGHPRKRGVI